jgi:hypothetical protein
VSPADPRVLAELRAILLRHGDDMRQALGPVPDLHPLIDRAVYRRLRDDSGDAAALAQFFVLGTPVAATRLEGALEPVLVRQLQERESPFPNTIASGRPSASLNTPGHSSRRMCRTHHSRTIS